MPDAYVHGYHPRENERLQDQAGALVELLHGDTAYPAGSAVLEAGCGVGAQTVTLARRSPGARIASIDIAAASLADAKRRIDRSGITNVEFRQADIYDLPFASESFEHVFVCFVLEHLSRPVRALEILGALINPAARSPSSRAITGRRIFIPTAPPLTRRFDVKSSCSAGPEEMRRSGAGSTP